MSLYRFLDEQERLTKKNLASWKEAKDYAKEHHLTCLTMTFKDFLAAFTKKTERLQEHVNYSKLEEMANEAMAANLGIGHSAIAANDFMRRIIEMPTPYIVDWLEGKNNLEWLPDYMSEVECDHLNTYPRDTVKDTNITSALHHFLKKGTQGIQLFRHSETNVSAYDHAIQYWSNSMGELHHHGEHDITAEELPAALKRVYQEYDLFERYGSRSYLVETEKGFGIALINEYDDGFANDCNLSMDKLFLSAMIDAVVIRSQPEFEKASIFLGEHLGFDSSHELAVVFPASISKEEFEKAARLLDDMAYQAAQELQRVDNVLNMSVFNLNVNGRTLNALKKTSFSTVADLIAVSNEELLKLPGWGKGATEDVTQAVTALAQERNVPNLRLWAYAFQANTTNQEIGVKPSLESQLQSASIRTMEIKDMANVKAKDTEYNR